MNFNYEKLRSVNNNNIERFKKTNMRSKSVDGIDPMLIGFKQQDIKYKKMDNIIQNTKDQLKDKIQKLNKLNVIKNGEIVLKKYSKKLRSMYIEHKEREIRNNMNNNQYYDYNPYYDNFNDNYNGNGYDDPNANANFPQYDNNNLYNGYGNGVDYQGNQQKQQSYQPYQQIQPSYPQNYQNQDYIYGNDGNNGTYQPNYNPQPQYNYRPNQYNDHNIQPNQPIDYNNQPIDYINQQIYDNNNQPNDYINQQIYHNNQPVYDNNLVAGDEVEDLILRNLNKYNKNNEREDIYWNQNNLVEIKDIMELNKSIISARQNINNLNINNNTKRKIDSIFDIQQHENKYKDYYINPQVSYNVNYEDEHLNKNNVNDFVNIFQAKREHKLLNSKKQESPYYFVNGKAVLKSKNNDNYNNNYSNK